MVESALQLLISCYHETVKGGDVTGFGGLYRKYMIMVINLLLQWSGSIVVGVDNIYFSTIY